MKTAMTDRYLVRCASSTGYAMSGIYASSLTPTGMVATWKRERAARYESERAAATVAVELARKFSGTVWKAEVARVDASTKKQPSNVHPCP